MKYDPNKLEALVHAFVFELDTETVAPAEGCPAPKGSISSIPEPTQTGK